MGLGDRSGKSSNIDIADYLTNNFELNLSRIEGVGEINVFGSQYAMRIWLDPIKLQHYQLTVGEVRSALENQNTQVAAGAIGDLPAPDDQYLNAKVTSGSLLKTPEQFENIIVKANNNGSFVYLKTLHVSRLVRKTIRCLTASMAIRQRACRYHLQWVLIW